MRKRQLYQVEATFDGTNPQTANLTAKTSYGQEYAVCTTIQYALKPVSNCTVLTVRPQGSDVITLTKTSGEMQKEAQDSGWFTVEPEFSWWFPWFRLHYKLDVNLPQGNPKLNYGWSPLPFGESSDANSTALARIMNDTTEGSDPQELALFFGAIAVPFVIQATVCYCLGYGPWAIGIATLVYGVFLAGFTMFTCVRADGNPKAWLIAFMSAAFVVMASLFLPPFGVAGVAGLWSTAARLVLGEIQYPLQALHALSMGFFAITTAIFVLMDFAVMVFLLSMYLKSIWV